MHLCPGGISPHPTRYESAFRCDQFINKNTARWLKFTIIGKVRCGVVAAEETDLK